MLIIFGWLVFLFEKQQLLKKKFYLAKILFKLFKNELQVKNHMKKQGWHLISYVFYCKW